MCVFYFCVCKSHIIICSGVSALIEYFVSFLTVCVCTIQEADGDDRLAFPDEGEMVGDSKAETPDAPPSTDNTPQCLNKALEGLSSRYPPVTLSSRATPQVLHVFVLYMYGCLDSSSLHMDIWTVSL